MNKKVSVKKLLAALVVLTMVATAAPAVMAAGSANLTLTSCVVNEGTVTVEFSIDKTNNMEHILVLVTPLGEDVNYENAVALQYKAISAASDTVDVLMPDDLPTGTYVVTVGSPVASDRVSERVSYMSYQERSMIVDNINSDTPDINDLVTAFNRSDVALEAAGINSAYYDALNKDAKREFAQYIVDHKLDGDEDNVVGNGDGRVDMKEIGSVANEAFVVVYASNETLSKNASELGFRDVFGGYEDFRLSDSDGRYRMISDYQGFFSVLRAQDTYSASIDGIKDSLEAALTLERINEAGYLNIADEILNYKRFFGVDTDASGITTEKLNEIIANETLNDFFGKAMRATGSEFSKVRDGEKLPVKKLEEFEKAWERSYEDAKRLYKDYKDKEDNKGSSSGSSSGSSGGKGSGSSGGSGGGSVSRNDVTYTVDYKTVRPDPLEKKKLIEDYYTDMEGYDWAEKAVLTLTENGIVDGTGDMKFSPENPLTREQFMKLLVNTFNLVDIKAESSFTDVTDKDAWYYIYVASAEKAGITEGYGDGRFGLGDYVTREEVATLVYRAAIKYGVNINTYGSNGIAYYSDMDSVADYARTAVTALVNGGVMDGVNGRFAPKDNATRAQAAVVIYNISTRKGLY